MKTAAYEVTELKAEADGPRGLFAARVSVFGNVDRNGDRVMPTAFDGTIARWKTSGRKIPVIWSHEHSDPESYIGEVDPGDVKTTKEGLIVAGRLFIDSDIPEVQRRAVQVYNLLKEGLVHNWSFAYEVKDERIADDLAREILEAEIFEVGPTLIGANPRAETLQVASAPTAEHEVIADAVARFETRMNELVEEKLGRVLSAKTEARIRAAMSELESILAALGEDSEDEPEAASAPPETKQPASPVESERVRRLDVLSDVGLFLAERGR